MPNPDMRHILKSKCPFLRMRLREKNGRGGILIALFQFSPHICFSKARQLGTFYREKLQDKKTCKNTHFHELKHCTFSSRKWSQNRTPKTTAKTAPKWSNNVNFQHWYSCPKMPRFVYNYCLDHLARPPTNCKSSGHCRTLSQADTKQPLRFASG